MGALSRPYRDCPSFYLDTRQFLPGYFHSPLPGLNRGSPLGIAMLQTSATGLKPFSVSANAFMRWVLETQSGTAPRSGGFSVIGQPVWNEMKVAS